VQTLRIPKDPLFLPILLEDNLAVDAANSTPTISKIPFVHAQFNARMNQRQFTLSYRLLPLNRRNAAQNGPRERLADPSASDLT